MRNAGRMCHGTILYEFRHETQKGLRMEGRVNATMRMNESNGEKKKHEGARIKFTRQNRLSSRPFVGDAISMLKHRPFQVLQCLSLIGLAEVLSRSIEVCEHDIQGMLCLGKRGW